MESNIIVMEDKFTDDTLMPFGKHEGKRLGDVPKDYLIWLYNENGLRPKLKEYVKTSFNLEEKPIKAQQQSEFDKALFRARMKRR